MCFSGLSIFEHLWFSFYYKRYDFTIYVFEFYGMWQKIWYSLIKDYYLSLWLGYWRPGSGAKLGVRGYYLPLQQPFSFLQVLAHICVFSSQQVLSVSTTPNSWSPSGQSNYQILCPTPPSMRLGENHSDFFRDGPHNAVITNEIQPRLFWDWLERGRCPPSIGSYVWEKVGLEVQQPVWYPEGKAWS